MSSETEPREPRKWSDISYRLKSAFAVLLSLAVLVGGGWFVYQKANQAWMNFRQAEDYVGNGEKEVTVIVPQGATLYSISDLLVEADVVKSAKAFDRAAAADSRSKSIQAGKYRLRTKLPAAQALALMLDPANQIYIKVLVREGLTLKEQFAVLAQPQSTTDKPGGAGFTEAQFQAAAAKPGELGLPGWAENHVEGFLFPDTYNVADARNASDVLKAMISRFKTVTEEQDLVAKAKQLKRTPYEIVTIASIIEAEVQRDEDRPKAARVIYNRLRAGMPLQMDSTVHYFTGKGGTALTTDEQRQTDNPYNTYLHKGLPPGPINSPGEKAIAAALNPAQGDWMYFVVGNPKTGETAFAVTYREHKRNVARFQEQCRANPGTC